MLASQRLDRAQLYLGSILFALFLVGYPVAGALSSLYYVSDQEISKSYRLIVILISITCFLIAVMRGKVRIDPLVHTFIFFYFIRMFVDWEYLRANDIEKAFPLFIAAVCAPIIGFAAGRDCYQERLSGYFVTAIGGVACALVGWIVIFTDILYFSGGYSEGSDRLFLEALNPISISYLGLFTAAAAIARLKWNRKPIQFLATGLVLMMAIFAFLAGASRGPVVAGAIAIMIIVVSSRRTVPLLIAVTVPAALGILAFGLPEILVERFSTVGYDTSSIERLNAISLSLRAALEHPLTGYAYVEPITGMYPHNLLVESALAIGLAGAALMLAMQVLMLVNAVVAVRRSEYLLPFIGLCALVNAWLSGSLWGDPTFYITLILLRSQNKAFRRARQSLAQTNSTVIDHRLSVAL